MKIKRILALAAAVIMITAAGCAAGNQDSSSEGTEGNSSMDYNNVTMTEKETELLCTYYPFDDERIRTGQLSEAQFNALAELRLGTDLIDTKYPGLSYDIVSFEPATITNGEGSVDIRIEGEGEKSYKAFIYYDENNKPYAAETVYGCEIRADYDGYICRLLEENGISAKSYTDFKTPVTNEVGRGTTPEDIIEQGSSIVRYTDIFVTDNSDRDGTVAKIKNVMEAHDIYAMYEVDFAPAIDGIDSRELEAGRRNYESTSFEVAEK